MATAAWLVLSVAGVAVSLAASWLLVARLERLGERAGFSGRRDPAVVLGAVGGGCAWASLLPWSDGLWVARLPGAG
jgi:hypothetical protein